MTTPAEHALSVLEAAAEMRRNVRAAIVEGGTVSTTTLGTPDAPSVIETPARCDWCGQDPRPADGSCCGDEP